MLPWLEHKVLRTLFRPERKLMMVDALGVGRFVRAAVNDPAAFQGGEGAIDLGREEVTIRELARKVRGILGVRLEVEFTKDREEAVGKGYYGPVADSQV